MSSLSLKQAEALPHPAVWRASRLSAAQGACLPTGYPSLATELPGQGWPRGSLIELLVPRAGIGELRVLLPALAALPSQRRIILVQPPYPPNVACCSSWQLEPSRLLWVRPPHAVDALWAADQVLKNGSSAALLCWLPQVRADALRRLHGAAQATDTLFVVIRPLQAAAQSSPAPLRLALYPAEGGVLVRFIKRRGPPRDLPLYLALHAAPQRVPAAVSSPATPITMSMPANSALSHAALDRRSSASSEPGRSLPVLAEAVR